MRGSRRRGTNLQSINRQLHNSESEFAGTQLGLTSSMVAVLEIGAFSELQLPVRPSLLRLTSVTSLLAAHVADKYGRRWTMRIGAFLFSIGGVFQTLCNGYRVMVFGRFVSGCGVGMLSMIVPIYQAESECALSRHANPQSPLPIT